MEREVVLLFGIAADVVVVYEVGGSHDIERSGGGFLHPHLLVLVNQLSVGQHLHTQLSLKLSLNSLLRHIIYIRSQLMILHRIRSQQGTLAIDGKRQGTLLVCRQVYDENVGSLRGKDSTLVAHAIHRVRRGVQCLGKTQRTTIVLRGSLSRIAERQKDAAHGQIAHTVRTLDEMLVNQSGGLQFAPCKDEVPHLRKCLKRLTTVVLMGRATPERLLVQLDFLYIGLSIDHCS